MRNFLAQSLSWLNNVLAQRAFCAPEQSNKKSNSSCLALALLSSPEQQTNQARAACLGQRSFNKTTTTSASLERAARKAQSFSRKGSRAKCKGRLVANVCAPLLAALLLRTKLATAFGAQRRQRTSGLSRSEPGSSFPFFSSYRH